MRPRSTFAKHLIPALATALVVGACGGGGGSSTQRAPEEGVLRIVANDTQDFDSDAYRVAAGEVRVEYLHSGFQAHTLVIEGIEDQFRLEVENGGTDSDTIILQPGRYILYCDVAGHRDGGMEARLLVE